MLSKLGQREQALNAAQEAANLYRQLAAARPEAFTPDLAASLNNLANMMSELGQREQALDAAQQAASLYRQLAAARPEAFTPGRADCDLDSCAIGQGEDFPMSKDAGGGVSITGSNVNTAGGDIVGRDKIEHFSSHQIDDVFGPIGKVIEAAGTA
jgi:tetratricopeptide (TPR) repeat protein